FEQWLYRHIEGIGDNVIMDFVDATRSGEYRMTPDPSEGKRQRIAAPLTPTAPPTAATNRAGAAVRLVGDGVMQVLIPLNNYGDHPARIYGRLVNRSQHVIAAFEEELQPAAAHTPVYSKATKLPAGSYKWFVAVRDLTTGTLYTDELPFDVK